MKPIKFTGEGVDSQFKGRVCLPSPINDYTICGITLDGDSGTAGDYEPTTDKINCTDCLAIIKVARAINKKYY